MRVDPLPSRPMKSETNNGGGSTLKFPQCRAESCSGNRIEFPVSDVSFSCWEVWFEIEMRAS